MSSVPDTNTFNLQDVVDVVEPSVNSLSNCFYDADIDKFDGDLMEMLDRLSNFRNYNGTREYVITFYVYSGGEPLENATVQIQGYNEKTTDEYGRVVFYDVSHSTNNETPYTVTKTGYIPASESESYILRNRSQTVNVTLTTIDGEYTVTFHVKDNGNNISGASISVGGQSGSTGTDGKVSFDLDKGEYSYTVSKSGYYNSNGLFWIDGNITLEVSLTAMPENQYYLYAHKYPGGGVLGGGVPLDYLLYDEGGMLLDGFYVSSSGTFYVEVEYPTEGDGDWISISSNTQGGDAGDDQTILFQIHETSQGHWTGEEREAYIKLKCYEQGQDRPDWVILVRQIEQS